MVTEAGEGKNLQPYELETPRTEQEAARVRRMIVTIARVFSSNSQIKVYPNAQEGQPWSCSIGSEAEPYYRQFMEGKRETLHDLPDDLFKPKVLYYDRESIYRHQLSEILGVLRHEIGHARNTDYRLWLEGQKFAQQQGYSPISWVNLVNSLEDTRVNTIEMQGSETVRAQMEKRYGDRKADIEGHTPTLPINLQLSKQILYYWVTGQVMPTITDKRVLEAFEQINPFIKQFSQTVSAEEADRIVREKIWPVYKTLEEQAQRDEEISQMVNNLQGQPQGEKAQGQGATAQSQGRESGFAQPAQQGSASADKPSPETGQSTSSGSLLQRIQSLIKREQEKAAQQSQEQYPEKPEEPDLGQQLAQAVDPNLQQQLTEEANRIKEGKGQPEDQDSPVQAQELSKDFRQKLEETLNNLPEEMKNQLVEAAKRELEEKAVKELEEEGDHKFTKFERNPQTGRMELTLNTESQEEAQKIEQSMQEMERQEQEAEAVEAQEKREVEAQRQQALRQEQERQRLIREMKKDGFEEREEEAFRRFQSYEEGVLRYVRNFIDRILPALPRREEVFYEGLYARGKKLDAQALARKVPIGDARVMKRKEVRQSEEAKIFVQLLIDNTGSMAGAKMEESIKTAIFWARVLKTLDVPFSIKLFGSQVLALKGFEQDYDDPRFKTKPKLMFEADARGGHTDIGSPLIASFEEMTQAKRVYVDSQGIICLITDGQPNAGLTGQALAEKAQEISKRFPIFVFGLGPKEMRLQQKLEEIFGKGKVIMPESFTQLPAESGRILLVQLHRLLRRYQV